MREEGDDASSQPEPGDLPQVARIHPPVEEQLKEMFPTIEKDEKDRELIRLALHKSPFFTCLDEEQVERFIQVAELKTYSAGESIILEGCLDEVEAELDDGTSSTPINQSTESLPLDAKADDSVMTEEGFVLVEKINATEDDSNATTKESTEGSPLQQTEYQHMALA